MIVAIWGENKTAKTTLALTFPSPIYHFDIDFGIDRARNSGYGKELLKDAVIETNPYSVPVQISSKVEGMRELWFKILKDYMDQLKKKEVKTIVFDTATQLLDVNRLSFLQERQEKDRTEGKRVREALGTFEYTEPNARMRSLFYMARAAGKNLVLTHYAQEEFKDRLTSTGQKESYRTGVMLLHGFKDTSGLVDLVIHTFNKYSDTGVPQPHGVITLSGLDLAMVGQEMEAPTYEKIEAMMSMLRGE